MKYWYQPPSQLLSDYLRTVLVFEGHSNADSHQMPIFTSGMAALVCHTEKQTDGTELLIHLTLYGKEVSEESLVINNSTTLLLFFFKPFAAASLLNIPAETLLKEPIDLRNWNPVLVNSLVPQLAIALGTNKKIRIVDHFLQHQLTLNKKNCEIILKATDYIMCNPGTNSLSELLKELDLNERTFQRIFKKHVGITPSQYRRICQFQTSFHQMRTNQFDKLTDIAYDNGFADQSHFIRSFKEFTQLTPQDYVKHGLKEKKQ